MLKLTDEVNSLENPSKLDKELNEFFEYLNSVLDLNKNSFQEALSKAIDEEEKFNEWKNSNKPLNNIRLFHKINDERVRINQYQGSFFDLYGNTVKVETVENSQFEIWECDKNHNPYFPLYRIPLSKVREEGELLINEKLRVNCLLKCQARVESDFISFTLSLVDLSTEASSAGRIDTFVSAYRKIWQKIFLLSQPQLASSLLILTFLTYVSLNLILSQRKTEGENNSVVSKDVINENPAGEQKMLISQVIQDAPETKSDTNEPEIQPRKFVIVPTNNAKNSKTSKKERERESNSLKVAALPVAKPAYQSDKTQESLIVTLGNTEPIKTDKLADETKDTKNIIPQKGFAFSVNKGSQNEDATKITKETSPNSGTNKYQPTGKSPSPPAEKSEKNCVWEKSPRGNRLNS